jgi:hypothetical protein
MKARIIDDLTKEAASAYSQIITRYPVMDRVDDAKKRLTALHQTVPRPTKAAVAQNRAEDESRRDSGAFGHLKSMLMKHPDTATATKVGDPSLADPMPVSAKNEVERMTRAAIGGAAGDKRLAAEVVSGTGTPPPNEEAPRSDNPPAAAGSSPFSQPAPGADPNELTPAAPAVNEAPANAAPDPNELKPNVDAQSEPTPPPPPQVNEIQQGNASSSTASTNTASSAPASDEDISSSKKKKKKGLKKVVPF